MHQESNLIFFGIAMSFQVIQLFAALTYPSIVEPTLPEVSR
jgi:hypothetical protein